MAQTTISKAQSHPVGTRRPVPHRSLDVSPVDGDSEVEPVTSLALQLDLDESLADPARRNTRVAARSIPFVVFYVDCSDVCVVYLTCRSKNTSVIE